jgi:hypothetical protein
MSNPSGQKEKTKGKQKDKLIITQQPEGRRTRTTDLALLENLLQAEE